MNNIFLFWIGDKKIVSSFAGQFDKSYNIIVGPSKKEDEFLSKKYKYYRDAKKNNAFAFMSDIWRLYKLSNEQGIYLDISIIIGRDFNNKYREISKEEVWLFKENKINVGNSVMYSSGSKEAKSFFSEILKRYENYEYDIPWLFPYGPSMITIEMIDRGMEYSFNKERIGFVFLDSLLSVRDRGSIFKYGSGGSWSPNKERSRNSNIEYVKDNWFGLERAWRKKKKFHPITVNDHLIWLERQKYFSIWGARDYYDNVESDESRIKISNLYNENKPSGIGFFSRMIWSKIYVFFKRK